MASVRTIGKAVALGTTIMLTFGAMQAQAQTSAGGHFRTAIDVNPDFSNIPQTAQRDGYVILADTRVNEMHQLKAANPNIKVLAYKNLTLMTPWTNAGVPLTDNLPESFYLHTMAGQRFTSQNFTQAYMANPADPAYQQKWAANVVSQVQQQGWDGVFMDDTNPSISYHHNPSDVREAPNDTAYSNAVSSMLAYVTPKIHAAGKLAVANIGAATDYPVARTWISNYLDGAMWEWWSGTQADLDLAQSAQNAGKFLLARQSGGSALYGYASMLLVSQNSYFADQTDYTHDPTWIPEFDYAIGQPTGAESIDSSGVHRRVFSKGIVVVNPTGSSRTVSLGGTYSGSGLTNVPSVSLAAHSAYVLTGSSSSSPPPPPPPATYTLTVSAAGNGSVTGTGISCPGDCTQTFTSGTVVNLTATPAAGSTFSGWGGSCSGTGSCSITMSAARSGSASFNTPPATTPPPTTKPSSHWHGKPRSKAKSKARLRPHRRLQALGS